MLYSLSYQMYRQEHGLETAAEQRAADARAGEAAAAVAATVEGLRLRLGSVVQPRHRGRPARGAADPVTVPVRFMSSVR